MNIVFKVVRLFHYLSNAHRSYIRSRFYDGSHGELRNTKTLG
jgi:hypothetical protein